MSEARAGETTSTASSRNGSANGETLLTVKGLTKYFPVNARFHHSPPVWAGAGG